MNTDYRQALDSALACHRAGHTDEALDFAGRCLEASGPVRDEAVIVVCEVLLRAGRTQELRGHLDRFRDLADSPKWQLLQARCEVQSGNSGVARSILERIKAECSDRKIARAATFDLVKLLDKAGEHESAWQTAAEEHRRSTHKFPVELLERALLVTAQAAQQTGRLKIRRASRDVERTAFLAGMPRSGTSLLEQMLDRHSAIVGVGENPLPGRMADAISAEGRGWPSGVQSVPVSTLDSWQERYTEFVRLQRGVPLENWSLDKTVFPMFQPLAVAAVLPGARVIRIVRDPRDTATSLFLSNFDPSWGWTGSLASIERVLTAERAFVPVILESLNIPSVEVQYENLVESPREALCPALKLLGEELEEDCLRPEDSARVVMTLSNEQVRSPINRQGIGRWQNYKQFFAKSSLLNFES